MEPLNHRGITLKNFNRMGVLYKLRCERCGVEFEHQAGIGFSISCIGCGESRDEQAPFWCPCCNLRYDPQSEGFSERLTEIILWD